MRVTNVRLILLMLTFFAGVLLVYLSGGGTIPILGEYPAEPERTYCSH